MVKVKDSAVSLFGVVIGQAIFFVCVTLIGRLGGPESLGRFNALLAVGTLLGTVVAFRYELACISDKAEESFRALLHVISLATLLSIVAFPLCVMGRPGNWAVALFAYAYFVQMTTGLYLNSLRRYGLIALCKVATNVVFAILLLVEGTHSAFLSYAILNGVTASVFLTGVLINGKRRNYPIRLKWSFYNEYSRYARYILPSTICASVLMYSLSIAIPAWYSADEAGYFAAAYRFGFFPVSLIGQSIAGVLRRDAIEAVSNDDPHLLLASVYRTYARWLLFITGGYLVCGAWLFHPAVSLLFGEKWSGATRFFFILMPLFALQVLYVPLSQVFLVTGKQRLDFTVQLGSGLSLGAVLVITHLLRVDIEITVLAFSAVGAACTLGGILVTARVAGVRCLELVNPFAVKESSVASGDRINMAREKYFK